MTCNYLKPDLATRRWFEDRTKYTAGEDRRRYCYNRISVALESASHPDAPPAPGDPIGTLYRDLEAKVRDEFYNGERLQKAIEQIRDAYSELVQIFAKVKVKHELSEEAGIVDVTLRIDEDCVYRIRRIEPATKGSP